jgi:hypothetical protein
MKNLKITMTLKSAIFLFLLMICVQPGFAEESFNSTKESAVLVDLKPFYKSDNGALIYARQEGSKVFWLAERFDRKFVAVFKGNYNGNTISGIYYNTPKGKAQGSGSLKVNVSNGGKTLKITGGNMDGQVLNAIARPTKFPARRRAHYRGDTKENLTGRWNASNAGQMHLLDKNNVIAGYFFGHQKGSNDRPSTAKIFFGTKNKNNTSINLEWFDLPLGLSYDNCNSKGKAKCIARSKGKASFKIVGPHFLRVVDGFIPGLNHERQTDDKLEILR